MTGALSVPSAGINGWMDVCVVWLTPALSIVWARQKQAASPFGLDDEPKTRREDTSSQTLNSAGTSCVPASPPGCISFCQLSDDGSHIVLFFTPFFGGFFVHAPFRLHKNKPERSTAKSPLFGPGGCRGQILRGTKWSLNIQKHPQMFSCSTLCCGRNQYLWAMKCF